jgi:hypothetical protein
LHTVRDQGRSKKGESEKVVVTDVFDINHHNTLTVEHTHSDLRSSNAPDKNKNKSADKIDK